MIEVDVTSVSIGRKEIVRKVGFDAVPGEITTIIGPNGSGKTTLLRAVSGDLAYQGTMRINGHEIARAQPWELAEMRAVLPQSSSLSFPFTVREVVRFGLTTGRSRASDDPGSFLVDQALDRVDLEGFAGRYYQELSGGEQQRVQLARVLCQVWEPVLESVPRYLFLDEPVSSLDIKHQLIIMDVARAYAEKGGGVIAILHDLNLASMYSNKVLVMKDGHLEGMGLPSEVIKTGLLQKVFDCALKVSAFPEKDPFVLPQSVVQATGRSA
ncbi:MAG: heme ABC transporter ATP-binding protein [Pseudomonadota bacterium]